MNPQTSFVEKDWVIVLNNQETSMLIVFEIPANTFMIKEQGKGEGLRVRKDRPNWIDLELNHVTFIDERSKYDFSPYIKTKLEY